MPALEPLEALARSRRVAWPRRRRAQPGSFQNPAPIPGEASRLEWHGRRPRGCGPLLLRPGLAPAWRGSRWPRWPADGPRSNNTAVRRPALALRPPYAFRLAPLTSRCSGATLAAACCPSMAWRGVAQPNPSLHAGVDHCQIGVWTGPRRVATWAGLWDGLIGWPRQHFLLAPREPERGRDEAR